MEGWLEIKLEYGDEIPEPITDSSFSEKFNLRIPKSLHKRLVVEALFSFIDCLSRHKAPECSRKST
jgi:hypothetical protein